MAKKTEQKGKKKKGPSGPTDTLREAVERTFAGASGGAAATRERAQDLLEDIATQLRGLRDANLVSTLEGLRDDVQALAKRVASLELRSGDAAPKKAATPARKAPAKRATTAAKSTTSRAKTTAAKAKPAARKPAAKKPATKKATSTRSTRSTTAKKKS